jgi:hypothetical protein
MSFSVDACVRPILVEALPEGLLSVYLFFTFPSSIAVSRTAKVGNSIAVFEKDVVVTSVPVEPIGGGYKPFNFSVAAKAVRPDSSIFELATASLNLMELVTNERVGLVVKERVDYLTLTPSDPSSKSCIFLQAAFRIALPAAPDGSGGLRRADGSVVSLGDVDVDVMFVDGKESIRRLKDSVQVPPPPRPP